LHRWKKHILEERAFGENEFRHYLQKCRGCSKKQEVRENAWVGASLFEAFDGTIDRDIVDLTEEEFEAKLRERSNHTK